MTMSARPPSDVSADEIDTDDEALALGMESSCREVMVGFANLDPRLKMLPFGGQPPWRRDRASGRVSRAL